MSPPSHIVAPLVGFATSAAAVIAMTAVVSPLLHGPEPTGRSLSAGSSTVTLSPPLRAQNPLALAVRADTVAGGADRLRIASAPAGPGLPVAPAATEPATFVPGDEQARKDRPAASRPEGLEREDTVAGGPAGASAPQSEPPTPAAEAPGPPTATPTTVELSEGTVTPDGPARRFHLRVVDLERTDHEVRVRLAIAAGSDHPESTVTVALKPASADGADGQAVKVSLDVVSGSVESPVLRVRVALIEDATGEASAAEVGETDTSNVVDVSVPVPATASEDGEQPAESPAELLLTLHPVESSAGSASATPTVSVTVTVTPEPAPDAAPVSTEPAAAPAPETVAEPSP
jgi:hypothetical protein